MGVGAAVGIWHAASCHSIIACNITNPQADLGLKATGSKEASPLTLFPLSKNRHGEYAQAPGTVHMGPKTCWAELSKGRETVCACCVSPSFSSGRPIARIVDRGVRPGRCRILTLAYRRGQVTFPYLLS